LAASAVTLNWQSVDGIVLPLVGGGSTTQTVHCPAGYNVVGGGWDYSGSASNDLVIVQDSYAASSTSWFFRFHNNSSLAFTIETKITCIQVTP
jgi:hypothetical protein